MDNEKIIIPSAADAPEPFVLTAENYYSPEADRRYMSNSMFKAVYGTPTDPYPCEAAALFAPRQTSEALIVGSYVDAAFDSPDAFEKYKEDHASDLRLKSGKGYYKFVTDADKIIARVKRDPVFMSYLEGEHQRIMSGAIAGHLFKIRMDVYLPGVRIVDLKCVKSAADSWNEAIKRRATFVEEYGYAVQAAIYQEIERQNSGSRLPFYIAYLTKEDPPDFDVVELPQDMLDEALEYVANCLLDRPMHRVRADPKMCGRRSCAWCRDQRKLSGPSSYVDFTERART